MHKISPKKLLIINILDILKRYTDENHRLSQKDILMILETEYAMKVDRKAIKRNLMNLIEFGYNIDYSESTRINKNGRMESVYTDWYLVRDFSDAELRLLIDSLLFSKHIPYSQCKALIGKLKELSSKHFSAKISHIRNMPEAFPNNKQLFHTIEILDEALEKHRQVAFNYNCFDIDKKMYPKAYKDGEVIKYIVNPYQMVATNGRYYLIGNLDKYDNISSYRLDRIANIALLDGPVKNMGSVKGLENGLNLPKHMAEHIYMFAGESVCVTFRAKRLIVNEIIDWFGTSCLFKRNGDKVDVTVRVNENAMLCWALQFGRYIEVLSPQSLRNEVAQTVAEIHKKYIK